uniref:(northern house mosquito) hypothetical protein n=1 Tax=Culex pipiens TaxID=7175 RepID=A0A8D8G770_CULPI
MFVFLCLLLLLLLLLDFYLPNLLGFLSGSGRVSKSGFDFDLVTSWMTKSVLYRWVYQSTREPCSTVPGGASPPAFPPPRQVSLLATSTFNAQPVIASEKFLSDDIAKS